MDINSMRIAFTVVSFAAFIGICFWAWSARNQKDFDEAAMLPFKQED